MSQPPYPPGMTYADPSLAPRRAGNGWAVASLICGLLACVPLIAQLLAIIFGIIGLRRSRITYSGKGLSIAGIVLGLIFILTWAGCGGAGALFWAKSKPVRLASHSFLEDAAAGRTDAALARCTSTVTADQINSFASSVSSYGGVKDVTVVGVNVNSDMGGTTWKTGGGVTFNNGQTVPVQLTLTDVNGQYKVSEFIAQTPAGTTTAAAASTAPAQPGQTP